MVSFVLLITVTIGIITIATGVIKERETLSQERINYAYKIGVKAGKINTSHYINPYDRYYEQNKHAAWVDGWCDGQKALRDGKAIWQKHLTNRPERGKMETD